MEWWSDGAVEVMEQVAVMEAVEWWSGGVVMST